MKNLLTLTLLVTNFYLNAQVTIMPAQTHAAIQVIQHDLNQNRTFSYSNID